MRSFYRYFIVSLVILFFASGCGGNSSTKSVFLQSDAEGLWEMVGYGYYEKELYCSTGSLNINASGTITGGDLMNFGFDKEIFTGGGLTITEGANVSGIIDIYLPDITSHLKYKVLDGQMTLDKTMILYAGRFPVPNLGIGILIKREGSFSSADIEGQWAFSLENGFFSVSLDNAGAIKSCNAAFISGDAASCNGSFLVGPDGSVTAHIEVAKKFIIPIDLKGQMNTGKNLINLAGNSPSRFEGTSTLAFRRNTASPHIKGIWKIFRLSHNETIYGELTIDENGNVLSGNWKEVYGKTGAFMRGSLTAAHDGHLSGSLTTSTGFTYTVIGGQISEDNTIVTGIDKDSSGLSGFMILVKTP